MPRYLILAQSKVTAAALDAWRSLLGGEARFGKELLPEAIVFDSPGGIGEAGVFAYHTLVQRLEIAAGLGDGAQVPGEIVVLVDSIRPEGLSAVSEGGSWDHLLALLILTFPEVRWIFGVIQRGAGDRCAGEGGFPAEEHDLLSLLTRPRRHPLLDPTGLREWVRERTNEKLRELARQESGEGKAGEDPEAPQLPRRASLCASIDEEVEFACMHGYAAWRYGFRSELVTSWSLMEYLFGKEAKKRGGHGYDLLLEDMRLQFPDKPGKDVHLSYLERRRDGKNEEGAGRAGHCPLLDDDHDTSRHRFLITTGQMGKDKDLLRANERYLARKVFGRGAVLYKPVGGILDLWERTNLIEDLEGEGRPGNAPGFIWPPEFCEEGPFDGHGAPGKLALVATTLLRRASQLRTTATMVTDFLRGAVLATEATELLAGRTPNLTLSGLALKHEFEVRAECAFVGAGYHFSLGRRLKELEQEVQAVAKWCHKPSRKRIGWDAQTTVLGRLVLLYREFGQQEEENACLVALRRLNRKLRRPKGLNAFFNPFAWMVHGALAYGEWLLASFSHLVLMTLLWIVSLAAGASEIGVASYYDPIHATSQVFSWTIGGGAQAFPHAAGLMRESMLMVLSWVGVVIGVFHLGILISYLYSLIARK